ncbi:hypothetical protein DN390_06810 [Bacillus sp. SH7-1]|nr:hypothetical protein COE87_22220 [Bacillus wiedmannii]TXS01256.1 hypothetical protein DN390_06810 [Bacillus sp. SH7-1]
MSYSEEELAYSAPKQKCRIFVLGYFLFLAG